MFKVSGALVAIMDTMQVSDKFKKRDFVIEIPDEKYPQKVSFQLAQDNVHLMDNYGVGETVSVSFNLRGREWSSPQGEVKYFNTLEAFRVEGSPKSKTNDIPF